MKNQIHVLVHFFDDTFLFIQIIILRPSLMHIVSHDMVLLAQKVSMEPKGGGLDVLQNKKNIYVKKWFLGHLEQKNWVENDPGWPASWKIPLSLTPA